MDERNQPVMVPWSRPPNQSVASGAFLKKRSQQKFHTKIVTIRVLDRTFLNNGVNEARQVNVAPFEQV
jgi:hypothetical protein